MIELTEDRKRTYVCGTCEVEFAIPQNEMAVCCPICRMNRITREE